MLYKTHTALAKDIGVNRLTIPRLIKKGEVKVIYDNKGNKYYIHIINFLTNLFNG